MLNKVPEVTLYFWVIKILALVAFLSVTKRDQTPPEVVIAETMQHPPHHHHHEHHHHASRRHATRLEPATQEEG